MLGCFTSLVGGGGGARKLCAGEACCELDCVVDVDVTAADGRWAEGEEIGAFMLASLLGCLGMRRPVVYGDGGDGGGDDEARLE